MQKQFTGLVLLLTLVASALVAACGGDDPTPTTRPTSTSPAPTITAPAPTATAPVIVAPVPSDVLLIALNEINDSGQSGWAKLVASGNDTHVTLSLSQGTMTSGLAHIHTGPCDPLGGVEHPLTSFSNGSSVTLLEGVSLDSLLTGALAINAHNADDPGIYTACGDIPDHDSYVTLALDELSFSAQSGFASLTSRNGNTEVVASLSEGTMSSGLVHIHSSICDYIGDVEHPLTSFSDGVSVTLLESVSLDSLRSEARAVNAHNTDDPGIYTACGNIPISESALEGAGPGGPDY
ncbi:MAG: CHRD domain-containing protein [Chloroflexi bacterium]|nr:CHRD domain-containing protein [Chloroflexota bacterium]